MKIYIKKTITSNFELLETPDKELGKGGQARVYKIQTRGYEDYCLKKFIREEDAQKNYDRIVYMIQHPPKNVMDSSSFRICWPVAFAYDLQKNFIGYIMPLAFQGSRDLKILEVYNAKPISQQAKYKKYPDWFDKYDLDTDEGLKNRLKMLCNWAIAIYTLHETHKYVIVDLKPENVMATSSGKISIVDTDSFQISENGKLLYPGAAYTPAYFPPEGKLIKQNNVPFPVACDCFSAAICFYKILIGVHPYGGTIKKYPYNQLETEEDFIREGLFAYGEKKQYLDFNASFNLHNNFENLLPNVQGLFVRAFGKNPGNRPTMEEWGRALYESAIYSGNLLKSVVKPAQTYAFSLKITDVQLGDEDENNVLIRNFGCRLYTDVCYLKPRITVQVLKTGQPVEVWYKIYSPSGKLQDGVKSKIGYTWKGTVNRKALITQSVILGGFGNSNKQCYSETGTWRIEFYENDRCLYKTTFEIYSLPVVSPSSYKPFTITTSKQQNPSPAWTPQSSSPKRKKKSKSKWWLWLFLLLGLLWAGYEFWFKDYIHDMNAPRTYVYATNLFLRSSKDEDSESNRIGKIPYGAEVVTYSNQNDWAEVKFDGETGYVSSDYLLSYDDFRLLDGVWGNEEAKEVVMTSKCRRAILDFLKYSNWKSGADAWQIYTKAKEVQPNSVLYPSLNDGYSDFSEFAFILTNNQTKKRKLVLYAFGKDESPILRHMEDAPDKGDIKSVSYSKWNNKYRVVYSGQSVANNAPQTDVKPKTEVKSNSKELLIESVSFANVDYNNKVIDSFGAQLYQDMQYLQPSVSFKRETVAAEKLKLQVKIWAPNGSMLRGSSSPGKCTFEQEVTLKGENGHFLMSGWGSKEGKVYTKGTYTYEIWHNGKKIFSTSLSIQNRPQTTSDKPVATTDYDNVIFERAEQMPLFPGGSNAMMKYLQKNLRYPAAASENGIEGRVTVSFVIEKDGSISNATVVKGGNSSLDREALRVVLAMPKWKPAMIGDRKVRFKYTIPVNFKLNQ